MKDINIDKYNSESERPYDDEIVYGYDELNKQWIKVKYRADSNCFFKIPYTGSLYPQDRMYKWKHI